MARQWKKYSHIGSHKYASYVTYQVLFWILLAKKTWEIVIVICLTMATLKYFLNDISKAIFPSKLSGLTVPWEQLTLII